MKFPLRFVLAATGFIMVGLTTPAFAADVAWTHELGVDALPNQQSSRWQPAGPGLSTLEESRLVLDSTEGREIYWTFEGGENDGDWDGNQPTTVEFRVRAPKVEDGMDGAGHLVVADGTNHYGFTIKDPEWHTYRIVLSGGTALLYTDGELASEQTLPSAQFLPGAGRNHIYFGDGGGALGGVTEWEFLRWTTEGAFPP